MTDRIAWAKGALMEEFCIIGMFGINGAPPDIEYTAKDRERIAYRVLGNKCCSDPEINEVLQQIGDECDNIAKFPARRQEVIKEIRRGINEGLYAGLAPAA